MSFSVANNYSPLNNYHYDKKPSIMSCLDFLSTPCRRVLGGRNVNVLTQTAENKMSTARKVMVIFVSVLIPVIPLIAISCLILKLATMPWIWEKKRIQVQSDKVSKLIEQFHAAVKTNNQEAVKLVTAHPYLARKNEVYHQFWKSLTQRVNDHAPWADLGPSISILRPADAIIMINHAIRTQISYELTLKFPVTTPQHVLDFIKKTLRPADVLRCYEGLISDNLHIDSKDDLLLNAIKLDTADQIIKDYVRMRKSLTPNQFGTIACDEVLLKNKLFEGGDGTYYRLPLLSTDPSIMQNIHATLDDIRMIRQLKGYCPGKVEALIATRNGTVKEQCTAIQAEFAHFEKNINELKAILNKTEVAYLHALQIAFIDEFTWLNAMIDMREGSTGISKEQFDQLCKKVQAGEVEMQQKLSALSNDDEVTGKCMPDKETSRNLRIMRRKELLECTAKMNQLLNAYMKLVVDNLSNRAKV